VLLKEENVLNRDVIIEISINMIMDTIQKAKAYFFETQHYLYITPHSFTDFIYTYQEQFDIKKNSLTDLQDRYETGLERLKNT